MRKLAVFLLMFLMATPAFAQRRGALRNVYASWVSVTTTSQTITFPENSRDLAIINGSSTDICVNLQGEAVEVDCMQGTPNRTFQLDGPDEIYLSDFITGSISLRTAAGTASPVSVVVTY